MNITDIFNNRSPKKINEAIETVFGKKLDLEAFTIEQLEDSRNRLRTQLYTVRTSSGFNETVENDSYTKAQWMLDAINAEVMQRDSQMVEEAAMFYAMHTNVRTGEPDPYHGPFASEQEAQAWIDSETPYPEEYSVDDRVGDLGQLEHGQPVQEGAIDPTPWTDADQAAVDADLVPGNFYIMASDRAQDRESPRNPTNSGFESAEEADAYFRANPEDFYDDAAIMQWNGKDFVPSVDEETDYGMTEGGDEPYMINDKEVDLRSVELEGGSFNDSSDTFATAATFMDGTPLSDDELDTLSDDSYLMSELLGGYDPHSHQAKTTLKHLKNPSYGDRADAATIKPGIGGVEDRIKFLQQAEKDGNLKDSIEQNINNGEDMTQVRESATDKASAVVTAKTMVDRVGRWIEELAGMENDTLLSLGDTIRDEMGQDQAKAFLSNVAPAIQQALQNLKATRETLATGVRGLTGEEQSAELIGSDTPDIGGDMGAGDEIAPVAPDEMNTGDEAPADEFGASEPAVGGMETAGRAQRESIDRSSQLLRVLAG